ncbi:putative membrane protein [Corynebacterium hansenii]|nr:putative membrane protein [Corynebacterium hansenii]
MEEMAERRIKNGMRDGWGLRVAAAAMLVGAGLTAWWQGAPDITGPDVMKPTRQTKVKDVDAAAFTNAQVGDCLTWDIADDGSVSNFVVVGCDEQHRYEVADRVDLRNVDPSIGQFGDDSPEPDQDTLLQLRDSVCREPVQKYVNGKLDPKGRFVPSPILPPSKSWADGDRTMLCGLQPTAAGGAPAQVKGRVADLDQATLVEAGQCVALDESGGLQPIDCGEPHLLEAVGKVDLREKFPDRTPTPDEQNEHLSQACVAAAEEYLGGEENLYQSTLLPFWMSIAPESYDAGTHSVNCWLMKDNGFGGFSSLAGSAKGEFTINGEPKVDPPPRNPLREGGSPQPTAPGAGAPTGTVGGGGAAGGGAAGN